MDLPRRVLSLPSLVLVLGLACQPSDPVPATDDGSTTDGSTTDGSTTAGSTTADTTSSPSDSTTQALDTTATETTGEAARCGDGIVDADEDCDDAGESATCNADCTLAACGDGLVNAAGGESCDDGGESATCNADCTLAACGDGIINASAGETCDDTGESLACNADCSPAACGDGVPNLTAGEDCDTAGASATCDADCTDAECGDGIINVLAGEQCDGADLEGATCVGLGFTIGTLTCNAGCTYDTGDCEVAPPDVPTLTLTFSPVKQFELGWAPTPGAAYYQVLESTAPAEPFAQLGPDVVGTAVSFTMPLHFRFEASYVLRACNFAGCTDSAVVDVTGSLAEAVGYFKASNTDVADQFGLAMALSGDGTTLAVGAPFEDGGVGGIDGDQADDSTTNGGAIYVFTRDATGSWTQQAYIKTPNPVLNHYFGGSVALSADGNTLAAGLEAGVGGIGLVYVFTRDAVGAWSQQTVVQASSSGLYDRFGNSVALSSDASTLAVGAYNEDSSATGVGGNALDDSALDAGAVYVFTLDGMGGWSEQAYIKASNTNAGDEFGHVVVLSDDGNTLAVGTPFEDSLAAGIDGDQTNDPGVGVNAGAVYVFTRNGVGVWSQQAYVKASNPDPYDEFGESVTLSGDGDTLAAGARVEDSSAVGIDGDQGNSSASTGAVYVFERDGMGVWTQQAYVKAANAGFNDQFGSSVALSSDGSALAVGATHENSDLVGVGVPGVGDGTSLAGAVYVFGRNEPGPWSQRAVLKAPVPDFADQFGTRVAISADAAVIAVGVPDEDSNATGIGGDPLDDSLSGSGAVYLY